MKAGKAEQPKTISRILKPFQLEGLAWLKAMEEKTKWHGGLLGDEMGLGKTIQAVSLIMVRFPGFPTCLLFCPPFSLPSNCYVPNNPSVRLSCQAAVSRFGPACCPHAVG